MLTKATRVASVQAVTYCNLYSLSVEHFYNVLEQYPMMRRTMESVAAERLNKLGKNPNIISNRQDLKIDQEALKDIVAKSTPCPSRSSSENDLNSLTRSNKLNLSNSKLNVANSDDDNQSSSQRKSETSPSKNKIKLLKSNLQVHIPLPNILKKSPSTPTKLFRRNSNERITTPEPSV